MGSTLIKFAAFALWIACIWALPGLVHAQDSERLLERVEYQSVDGKARIYIRLDALVAYVSHFPKERGNTLEIQIRTPSQVTGDDAIKTEAILAPASVVVPLAGVSFDGTDSAKQLIVLRFTRPVTYRVRITEDQRGLLVTLPDITYLGPEQERPGDGASPGLMTLEDLGLSKEQEAADLMVSGRAQLAAGNYAEAARLFTQVLDLPDHSLRKEAETLLLTVRSEQRRAAAESPPPPLLGLTPEPAEAGVAAVATTVAVAGAAAAGEAPVPEVAAEETPRVPPAEAAAPAQVAGTRAPPASSEVERQLEFGRVAMARGDHRTAMRIFSIVVATSAEPYKSQAQALLVEAEAAADAAPASLAQPQPSQAQAWLEQGQQALRVGNASAAAVLAQRVVASGETGLQEQAQALLAQARQAETAAVLRAPLASSSDESAQAGEAGGLRADAQAERPEELVGEAGEAAALLDRGIAAMKANDLQSAIDAFSAILAMPVGDQTSEAERLLRLATRQQAERVGGDLRGPIMGEPATLEDVARIMEQGKLALNEGDHNRAIVAFTKLTSLPEHPQSKEALEMLGVARQRNNQLAHAKAAFQDYLKKYPEGEDAVRVKQRLADLISSQMKPQEKLPTKGAQGPSSEFKTDVFGSLSQYYYYGLIEVEDLRPTTPEEEEEDTGAREDQNMLISYVTANSRSRNDRYEIRSFIYGTHTIDFINEEDPERQGTRVEFSNLYADMKDKNLGWYGRVGRQSSTTAGVLGRFDGLHVAYDWRPKTHFNTVIGFPVDLNNKDSIEFETSFFTFNTEFENVFTGLDIVPYITLQQSEGLLDRFAVGDEIRFFSPRGTLFNLIDYDVSYGELNIFLLHGQLNLSKAAVLHLNLDYRNSPLLYTRNALINEPQFESLEALQELNTEDEIRDMAVDKTGTSSIATFGAAYSFTERIQLSGDLTWTRQEYSPESVAESPDLLSAEDAVYLMLRLTTTGVLASRDMHIFGATITSADNYDNTNWLFQTRAPFGEGWAADGILRFDVREDLKGEELRRTRPSLKMSYNWRRQLTLEVEAGVEISKYGGNTQNQDSTRTFGSAGYRWNF